MDIQLKKIFEENEIKYISHTHAPAHTVVESKEITRDIPGIHGKSLFLKDEHQKGYLVCLSVEKRLDTKIIKKIQNIKSLVFASPIELERELKTLPGHVSPFAIRHAKNTILIIDEELWQAQRVAFHPEINTETIEMVHEDFKKWFEGVLASKTVYCCSKNHE